MAATTQVRILVWTFFWIIACGPDLYFCRYMQRKTKLPGGFEPPSLDSESRVLTVTPWERVIFRIHAVHSWRILPNGGASAYSFAAEQLNRTGLTTSDLPILQQRVRVLPANSQMGSWCSGITSASHAEGPGFKSQRVQVL